MAEVELSDIFKIRWVKRTIYLIILVLIIWKFFPNAIFWFSRNSLDSSARIIANIIRSAKSYTINHEDYYAADFNMNDNTFALVYPRQKNPQERKIVEDMKVLPKGIDIIKCTFQPILIEGKEDPDFNQIIFRITFEKEGGSFLDEAAIWIGNKQGEVRGISVTNPGGKIEIFESSGSFSPDGSS